MSGELNFIAKLDNSKLIANASQARRILNEIGDTGEDSGNRIQQSFSKAGSYIKSSLAGVGIGMFVKKVYEVRSAFQDTESAMTVFLGSAQKAQNFMKKLQDYAWYNMFEFTDLTQASSQLLAFGNDVNDVIPILDKLSNIASGTKQPLMELVAAYNKAKNTGKVTSVDLASWGARGLVITDELKKLGIEVDRSEVKFEHLKKVIDSVTGEGGMFHGLMEAQMGNLSSSFGQLQDEISKMFNEIGTVMQDAMKTGIDAASYIVKHYKEIGKAIIELVAVYGVYRVALATTNAAQRLNMMVLRRAVVEKKLAAMEGIRLANSEAVATARTKLLALAQQGLVKALKAVRAAIISNPLTMLAAGIALVVYGIYKLITAETAAEKAHKAANSIIRETSERYEEQAGELDTLTGKIRDENTLMGTRIKLWKEFLALAGKGNPFENMSLDEFNKLSIDDTKKLINYNQEKQIENDLQSQIQDIEKLIELYKDYREQTKKGVYDNKEKIDTSRGAFNSLYDELKSKYANNDEILTVIKEYYQVIRGEEKSSLLQTLSGLKEQLKLQQEVTKENEIDTWSEENKIKYYDEQSRLLEEQIAKVKELAEKAGNIPDALNPFVSILNVLSSKLSEVNSKKDKLTGSDKTNKGKSYWEEQLKSAKDAIENIDSDTLTKLKKGDKKGIDATTVEDYKENIKLKKEAETKLLAYDDKNMNKTKQEELSNQKKLAEDLLALRSKNIHDEISLMKDGAEKKLKQINADFDDQKAAIEKQARELSETNKKANLKDKLNSNGLTAGQQAEIDRANKLNAANRTKLEADVYKSEIYAMRDYLKEYGTLQQQKLSIAEEYAEKINNAQSKGERLQLEKQQQEAIGDIEIKAIKAQIDWVTVFGEFGGMFRDIIRPALDEAKEYIKTDEFNNSDQASQSALITAINQMEKSLGGAGTLNFKKLGKEVQVYHDSLRDLNDARTRETEAINKLIKAQKDYEKAVKGGTEEEKKTAKASLENAQSNADAASANVKTQTNLVNQNQQAVSDTASKLKVSMENVTEGLSKLASGGLKGAYDGLIQAGKGMGGAMEKVAESLESVPIVGWILSIIDVLKDGLSNLVGGLLDAVFKAVGGIINDVLSGDLFATIFESIVSGIGNILNGISFGGWNSLMDSINGSNAKEVNETTDRLTASNKVLKQSIDALRDEIGKARGLETVKAYNEAVKKQKEVIENTGDILAAQMSYTSAHHSNNYYISRSMSNNDWERISKEVGKDVRNMSDLWNLSPEDLRKVSTLTDIWEKIYNGGKYNKSSYLDQYLALADTLEELEQGLRETLTQTTFDNVYDSFVDTLMDMNASAEDFADNISEYFMRAMLSNQIGKEYADKLDEWYKKFAEGMSDGTLSDAERDALKNEYMRYVDAAIKERDELASIIGYGEANREAYQKGFASMSQDSADELNGRFTALQALTFEINNGVKLLVTSSQSALQYLAGIESNTKYCMELQSMRVDMASLKANINEINTIGVRIRP
ncbi:MAG: phage tail tape measure protein [Prevotellaceae bacterium]|jgi:hypothetical protein|nr:phage tail tape measure protein [Prevotellaceae bacterium]